MPKSTAHSNAWLQHVLANVPFANVGDATGLPASATAGSTWFALHTGALAVGDGQNVNEANYTGYARVGITRSTGEWTFVNNAASNTNAITLGQCTAGSSNCTHFSVGRDQTGTGLVFYSGPLSPTINVVPPIAPSVAAGDLDIDES